MKRVCVQLVIFMVLVGNAVIAVSARAQVKISIPFELRLIESGDPPLIGPGPGRIIFSGPAFFTRDEIEPIGDGNLSGFPGESYDQNLIYSCSRYEGKPHCYV